MNLIDFHVTKIISEEYGKMYELFNMTRESVDNEDGEKWRKFLLSDGIKQTYEYWDDGGYATSNAIFELGKPLYFVGYIGQH